MIEFTTIFLNHEGEKLYDLNEKAPTEEVFYYEGSLWIDPLDIEYVHKTTPYHNKDACTIGTRSCERFTIIMEAGKLAAIVREAKSKHLLNIN